MAFCLSTLLLGLDADAGVQWCEEDRVRGTEIPPERGARGEGRERRSEDRENEETKRPAEP